MNLNCFADCKCVAVSAIGHPGVEFELLLQVVALLLQVANLSQDYSRLSEQSPVNVLVRKKSVTGVSWRTCDPRTSTTAFRAVG